MAQGGGVVKYAFKTPSPLLTGGGDVEIPFSRWTRSGVGKK